MSIFSKISAAGIVRRSEAVDLGDFDEAYRGATFDVWVTPTRAHLQTWAEISRWLEATTTKARQARDALPADEREAFDAGTAEKLQEAYDERLVAWLAETWVNVDREEARQIFDRLQETNPRAWEWLVHRTHSVIGEFKRRIVGNSRGG
jgi:hypothetical protein